MKAARLIFVVLALIAPGVAGAGEIVHETREQVLARFFQGSTSVGHERFALDDAAATEFRRSLGYDAPRREYVVYIGRGANGIDGYALIDNEMGKHRPMTFAVHIGPDGAVRESALMVYREDVGGQVREKPFMRQFVGKRPGDPIRLGAGIDGISGATISSRAICVGVQRSIWIVDRFRRRP